MLRHAHKDREAFLQAVAATAGLDLSSGKLEPAYFVAGDKYNGPATLDARHQCSHVLIASDGHHVLLAGCSIGVHTMLLPIDARHVLLDIDACIRGCSPLVLVGC